MAVQRQQSPPTTSQNAHVPRPSGLNVVGLFAGVGGLELGLARTGHRSTLLCEIEPGARAVLRSNFKETPLHDDVCTLETIPADTDLLVGGFPCQDLSQAGRTRGIAGSRSGLVEHVFRLITRTRVPLVLLENVPFMLQLDSGQGMSYLVDRFEKLGYSWAYRVVDTRAFGLPQRRRRVCFLASKQIDPAAVLFADDAGPPNNGRLGGVAMEGRAPGVMHGFYWTEGNRGLGWAVDSVPTLKGGSSVGIPSPPAIWTAEDTFGTPDIRDAERLQGFPADWTAPAETVVRRGYRWKLVGNAVTVGVAEWLGGRLASPGSNLQFVSTPFSPPPWPSAAYGSNGRRFHALVSEWPVRKRRPHLHTFLRHDLNPLSAKAASGFLNRISQSSLHVPSDFLTTLADYVNIQRGATRDVCSEGTLGAT